MTCHCQSTFFFLFGFWVPCTLAWLNCSHAIEHFFFFFCPHVQTILIFTPSPPKKIAVMFRFFYFKPYVYYVLPPINGFTWCMHAMNMPIPLSAKSGASQGGLKISVCNCVHIIDPDLVSPLCVSPLPSLCFSPSPCIPPSPCVPPLFAFPLPLSFFFINYC